MRSLVEEKAALLRAEVHGLVVSQLQEMVASQVAMTEAVQGLLERLGAVWSGPRLL